MLEEILAFYQYDLLLETPDSHCSSEEVSLMF